MRRAALTIVLVPVIGGVVVGLLMHYLVGFERHHVEGDQSESVRKLCKRERT